jgi:hypothetical protein
MNWKGSERKLLWPERDRTADATVEIRVERLPNRNQSVIAMLTRSVSESGVGPLVGPLEPHPSRLFRGLPRFVRMHVRSF